MFPRLSTTTTEAFPLEVFTVAVSKILELIVNEVLNPCNLTKEVFAKLDPEMLRRVLVVPVKGEIPVTVGFW